MRASQEAVSGVSSSSNGVRASAWQQGSSDRALPLSMLSARRGFSSLPPHQVVGLPALSPVSGRMLEHT